MDFEICKTGCEAASLSHLEPSSELPGVSSSTSSSPSSPLSRTVSSSLSATSSLDDLLATTDPIDHLDSFLEDALNSRNRITVLRLELEIEKFVRDGKQQQLILNPMPSSYERLVAHRVAQHYRVQSMPLDSSTPSASRILLVKTMLSRIPGVRLAEIPTNLSIESNPTSPPPGKLALKQRSREGSIGSESGTSGGVTPIKSVEERMEDYNKARARIFSNGDSGRSEPLPLHDTTSSGESERDECEDDLGVKAANTVAVFRDREKDMKDPDYDRSYDRYSQPMKIVTSLSASVTRGLSPSSLANQGAACGQLQRQASYLAPENHGCVWFGAGALPVMGYPTVLPNAFTQGFYPRYTNVYNCNQEFAYPRHYSSVDWRQDPTKVKPHSMSSTHPTGWFPN